MGLGSEWDWSAFWLESIRDFIITVVAFMLAWLAAFRIFRREQQVADDIRMRQEARRDDERARRARTLALDREHMAMAQLYKMALRGQSIHERTVEFIATRVPDDPLAVEKHDAERKRLYEDFSFWQIDGLSFIPDYADTEAGRIARSFIAKGCHVFWVLTDPTRDHAMTSASRSEFNGQTEDVFEKLNALSDLDMLPPDYFRRDG